MLQSHGEVEMRSQLMGLLFTREDQVVSAHLELREKEAVEVSQTLIQQRSRQIRESH